MMKRTAVARLGPDEPPAMTSQSPAQIQQAGASNMHTLAQSAQPQQLLGATAMLSVGGVGSVPGVGNVGTVGPGSLGVGPSFGRAAPRAAPPVINYLKAGAVQYAASKQPQGPPRLKTSNVEPYPQLFEHQPHHAQPHQPHQPHALAGRASPPQPGAQFQRLKVEDALSYLDQVKYKFNTQPQVYNDFLDIMKEFKSQTIDTPGVITRVSNLFKGHPELIVGFNTFLPPGYKIEVQSNGQVSVSMPSPSGAGVLLPQPHLVQLLPVPHQSVSSAIVHNLSVTAAPANTLHHISQAHQQIEAASIHHSSGTVQPPAGSSPHAATAPPGQPVEFNHAIEYVNKIKSRFSRQPDKYKRFLEILHAYQRGHRDVKEPQAKQQTEQEVYSQVAKLFENQDDLLAEFGQFLPDAKAVTKPAHYPLARTPPPQQQRVEGEPERAPPSPPIVQHSALPHLHAQPAAKHPPAAAAPLQHLKRSPSFSSSTQLPTGAPPAKKARAAGLAAVAGAGAGAVAGAGAGCARDVSHAEAARLATHRDYSFFDRARKALRSQHVYDNFLRCLLLFTNEIISSSELLMVTGPFLVRHPELHKWLQDFVGPAEAEPEPRPLAHTGYNNTSFSSSNSLLSFDRERGVERGGERALDKVRYEPLGPLGAQLRHERPQGDAAMDIDLSTCKRLGTSYCALPRDAAARRCSGRTALCKEVLNDTWVSFPTWSEDSTFVTSRKTQYEEYIYRCEDERFELDVVIETNAATIRVLEGVQKKLSRLSADDAARHRLDDCLGGSSPTAHQRALRRIYGEKVAVDIIAGLKKNPVVAVPVVLRRLKAKEEEWREAQKGFNKQWREQNEKYYLKSLDHQGINFKQNDLKAMRSKALFNEVESAYAARRPGPHLVVDYAMHSRQEAIKILRDCTELLIHHARRQTAIQKAEKRRIKQLLRQFLPDLFNHPRQPLSDDERDEEEKEEPASPGSAGDAADVQPPAAVKQEKPEQSSESDNASDKSGRNNKNDKENKPKNNNNTDLKECINAPISVKRNSNEEPPKDVKVEGNDLADDYRDHPPNEARFVCTSSWYLFLRLHGTLCARLGAARRAAAALAERERAAAARQPPSVAAALRLKPNNLPAEASSPAAYYGALLELVRGVLDGNTDAAAYEDAAREMLGIRAYPAYTLDKLVSHIVRQLQHCVSEPWSVRAAELCAAGGMRGPPAYVRRAARYLRHEHNAFLVKVYGGDECRVSFELLEAPPPRASPPLDARLSPTQRNSNNGRGLVPRAAWPLYAARYARADGCGAAQAGAGAGAGAARNKPVFLARNARRCGDGYTHNVANAAAATASVGGATRARRKPPKLHDHTECQLSDDLRLLSFRPLSLYRSGALAAAKASHARLHARRRARLRAWLMR